LAPTRPTVMRPINYLGSNGDQSLSDGGVFCIST
jgi:hypothetical protein